MRGFIYRSIITALFTVLIESVDYFADWINIPLWASLILASLLAVTDWIIIVGVED